jgi:hypothetical protein
VVLPYVVGELLPYFVNGLHHLRLSEVASGRYDPKGLWPQGVVAGPVQLAGLLSLVLTPVGLGCVALASAACALLEVLPGRGRPRPPALVVVFLLVLAVACPAGIAWLSRPTADALATCRLD